MTVFCRGWIGRVKIQPGQHVETDEIDQVVYQIGFSLHTFSD